MADVLLPALADQVNPCLCCPPIPGRLCPQAELHPGFGMVSFWREDDPDWAPPDCLELREDVRLSDFEQLALAAPDHDWRVKVSAPLSDATCQRHGEGLWVLVEKGPGFA